MPSQPRRWATVTIALTLALSLPGTAAAEITGTPDYMAQTDGADSGGGAFAYPHGMAVGGEDVLFVVDSDKDRIVMYDLITFDYLGQFGTPGSGDGEFDDPRGVAVSRLGEVFVTDHGNFRVQVFSHSGTYLRQWGSFGTANNHFTGPTGIAIGGNLDVYVVDNGSHRVQQFDPNGLYKGTIGTTGVQSSADGQFNSPYGITASSDGLHLYVTEQNNRRVQKFDLNRAFVTKWGTFGTGNGQFSNPGGIATGEDGTVYVADAALHRVQAFSPTGQYLTQWGSSGTGNGQFNGPWGVATSPFGIVLVADTDNGRVQKFGFSQVIRAAGADRYATAAAIAELHFPIRPGGVHTTLIATGLNFPDALAAGRLMYSNSSMLLVTNGSPGIPTRTGDVLNRIIPASLLVFGGTAAITTATEAQLIADFAPVERVAGANRYETAVRISEEQLPFGFTADAVVVASGLGFADALAGVPFAFVEQAPVLLTAPGSLPDIVRDRIEELDPDKIWLLGGTAAVSDTVLAQLNAIAPTERIAGANRYLTAVAISEKAFPDGAEIVYIAVGTNFPDALAAAGYAGFRRAPVLLTPTDSLPAAVAAEITRLGPRTIIILGGNSVVSTTVENQLKALLGI